MTLDPWEEFVLASSLGERPDGRWAAKEVGLVVPRQNGKGEILLAREIAGLFLLGERLIIHSAHEFSTALEHFRRLMDILEGNEEFARRIKSSTWGNGKEGIELTTGQRVKFKARTKGGGRGFSADCLVLDEAMDLPVPAHGAMFPTLSARPNPQVWYAGSAVDQNVHEHGIVLAGIRARGMKGGDPALAYFEWSADADLADMSDIAGDRSVWAQANPGLGIRITAEHIALEQRSMDPRTFAVERLGVGDWPSLGTDEGDEITREQWAACEDPNSTPVDPVAFAFDVRPDRQSSAVSVAGFREDGLRHVEVLEHKSGTRWVLDYLEERVERHDCGPVLFAANSPAAALKKGLEERGIPFEEVSGTDYSQACAAFVDDVAEGQLRHRVDLSLAAAVRGAKKRPLGDAWAWSRKNSAVDITPLVSCSLARWAVTVDRPSVYEQRGVLVV